MALTYTESGETRKAEVLAFIDTIEDEAERLEAESNFEALLDYLTNYGGKNEHGRDRFNVELGRDFALNSFTIVWSHRGSDGLYKPSMFGAAIYRRDGHDWGVHT